MNMSIYGYLKDNLGGTLFFSTFIDDFLRTLRCFALKTKDQQFQIIKNFHASDERETGRIYSCR